MGIVAALASALLVAGGVATPTQAAAPLVVSAADAATGKPVKGFCVTATTCTDGSELTLPAGTATVTVTPVKTSNHLPSGVVAVPAGATAVTVPLNLGGRVSTTVTDRATGLPVRLACLVLIEPGTGGLREEGHNRSTTREECSNNNGKLTSYARPAGTYQAFMFAPERRFLPKDKYGHQWVGAEGGTGDQRQAARIKVRAGEVTSAPDVLLDAPGTVTGQVRTAHGKPVGGTISFNAWPRGGTAYDGVTTKRRGQYTYTHLGPYEWPIVVTPSESSGFGRQFAGGTSNRFLADTVVVRSGETSTLDITLAPKAALVGTLTVPAGRGRLVAVNAITRDEIGYTYFTGPGEYRMPVAGGQPVEIQWILATGASGRLPDQIQVRRFGDTPLDVVAG